MTDTHSALLWLIPLVVALDLVFPWPSRLPHPVRLIGRWLELLEPPLRSLAPSLERTEGFLPDVLCSGLVRAGALGVALTVILTAAVTAALCGVPFAGWLAAVFSGWSGLALGDLLRAGREALAVLDRAGPGESLTPDDLAEARALVGGLVSRDVSRADERDLYRSLAESLAENFNDAFVAPLFWLAVGGPVMLWVSRAASTMDSMWGYRTGRWELMGKAAARLDDVLAFVPARLSAFLLWVTALGRESGDGGGWPGVATVRRQAARMSSPNAGWPMAAAAWLHGAPMGGPTVYHGVVVDKPRLGPEEDSAGGTIGVWNARRVRSLMRHMFMAGMAGTGLAVMCLWLVLAVV